MHFPPGSNNSSSFSYYNASNHVLDMYKCIVADVTFSNISQILKIKMLGRYF